jgi:ribonucleoside-diphosphate reductase alpha chain
MRNSNCMAIAPTATISNIVGVSQSIEPTYQNLFVKSNLSGEFTVVNPYLVRDLKALGLWDAVMVNDLKYFDGSVQPIERIPQELKDLYATAFEIDPRWLVEAGSRRQKWLDQAQSLNLYLKEPNGKKLDNLYKLAWVRGLKTTYYLRSMGASHVEKSTMADPGKGQRPGPIAGIQLASKAFAQLAGQINGQPNAQFKGQGHGQRNDQPHGQLNGQAIGEVDKIFTLIPAPPKACSLLDPECEACQ